MYQFVPATRRFDHIHVDIVGPLPPSQNYRYLLTVVDRFTRWPEAIPLVDAQTTTCAKALALHWIARFGVPAELTSDRGSQFTSEFWATLSQLNGTRLHRTTAYHPPTDCSGRFSATWSGHRRRCAVPTSTSRDSSQVGTSSSRSTWHETVICADCARRQPFRVRQTRQSPPAAHAALRGPLQGVGARR